MLKKLRQTDPGNLWNRLGRDLIYDAKQVLLYCGVKVPHRASNGVDDYADIVGRTTRGTDYGAIYDPTTRRIHFEPGYIQKAEMIYRKPTLIFNRGKDALLEVIIETIDNFRGDFGRHDHTLKNIPVEWF